ncbi:MAG: helix-turn-helix domain-containing protein [Kiritimatiellae bacterium]|nr:helix-turn-helix domain-containing protein [Kiritimatiellia bacterium]
MKEPVAAGLLFDAGAAVRRRRLGMNLSQREVAARAGVCCTAVLHLEEGRGVSLKTFLAVCVALGAADWIGGFAREGGGEGVRCHAYGGRDAKAKGKKNGKRGKGLSRS